MAIIVNGSEFRTLEQPIYVNGERVTEGYFDGILCYPETGRDHNRQYLTIGGSSIERCEIELCRKYTGEPVVVTIGVSVSYTATLHVGNPEYKFTRWPGDVLVLRDHGGLDIVSSRFSVAVTPVLDGDGITATTDYFPMAYGTVTTFKSMDLGPFVNGTFDGGDSGEFSLGARSVGGPIWPRRFPAKTPYEVPEGLSVSGGIYHSTDGTWVNTDGKSGRIPLSRGESMIAGARFRAFEVFDVREQDMYLWSESPPPRYMQPRAISVTCRCGVMAVS